MSDAPVTVEVITDAQLLAQFVHERTTGQTPAHGGEPGEAAFSQLVTRHGGWVYAQARRQSGDAHLAEDISQAVFLLLAQKAHTMRPETLLSAWLFTATGYAVRTARRNAARRAQRERKVAQEQPQTPSAPPTPELWHELEPRLDAALAALPAVERNALLLRYFQDKPVKEVGALLELSEPAVRKRIERALEKLRVRLGAEHLTTGMLGAGMVASSAQAVPVGLSHTLTQVAAGKVAVTSSVVLLSKGASTMFAIAKAKLIGLVVAGFMLVSTTGVVLKVLAEAPASKAIPVTTAPSESPPASAPTSQPTTQPHAFRKFPIKVVDGEGKPVSEAIISAASDYKSVAQATTDASGLATLQVPADLPLMYILAMKPKVGLDYFTFYDKTEIHNTPYRLDSDFTGPLNFVLDGAKTVTVEARDKAGHPIAGARVYPWLLQKPHKGGENDMLNIAGNSLFDQTTNAQGLATYEMIPANDTKRITFWVRKDGYTSLERWTYDPTLDSSKLVATLVPTIPVVGRVLNEAGKPAGNATVRISGAGYRHESFYPQEVQTKVDGTFTVDVDPEEFYIFMAQQGHKVSALLSCVIKQQAPTNPIELRLQPGRRVFGTITMGPDNVTLPKSSAYLIVSGNDLYKQLPEDQKLTPPDRALGPRLAINPQISQNVYANEQGNFEFYTCPGSQRVGSDTTRDGVDKFIVIADEEEVEVDLHSPLAPEIKPLKGRIVLPDNPESGVADVTLAGASTFRTNMNEPTGITDKQGNFTLQGWSYDYYLYATTADHKMATIQLIKPDDENITVTLNPTTSATGKLIDSEGHPLARRQINFGVWVTTVDKTSSLQFGGNTITSDDGAFTIPGMVPESAYEIQLVKTIDKTWGHANAWQHLSKITPTSTDPIELGELTGDKNAVQIPVVTTQPK